MKKLRTVKNYIVAEEKVAEVARFSSQHFLPVTISSYKVAYPCLGIELQFL